MSIPELKLEDAKLTPWSWIGTKVRIHWHLREHKWSVSYYSHLKKGWRVIRDEDGKQVLYTKVVLRDVTFKVNENGRQRVLKEKCKNVHAWMEGVVLALDTENTEVNVPCGVKVKYNPYYFNQFYTRLEDNTDAIANPVYYAELAAAGSKTGVLVPEWALNTKVYTYGMETA
jgi:hypothetical protein